MPSCIKQLTHVARHFTLASIVIFALMACGGGGGGTPGTSVISGIVSDDAIVGATVTATSLDSGLVLGTAVTEADGSYAMSTPTSAIGSGYNLSSAGGTMNGVVFDSSLSATYTAAHPAQSANLTLVTTSLVEAANTSTNYTGSYQQKHAVIVADAIQRGVLPSNYYVVDTGALTAMLRLQTTTIGLPATTAGFGQNLSAGLRTVSGCGFNDPTCIVDVSSAREELSVTYKGAIVSAPADALGSCRVVVTHDVAKQAMTVQLENITSGVAGSTAPTSVKCTPTGSIKLTLPPVTAEVPEACLPVGKSATRMSHCVTIDAGFVPSYLAKAVGYNHRTNKNPFTVPAAFGLAVELSRSYGAVLHSSDTPSSEWAGKTPVIFVHGYTPSLLGFGGDDGTWDNLPALVLEDTSFVALNFQWRTDASYLTVAKELAKAVDYAYLSTGKKAHIVAHSFGGVLSRVMLQNLEGTTKDAATKVATLTTIGSPHSGILTSSNVVDSIRLPDGWGSWFQSGVNVGCAQISCFQSGLKTAIAPWALTELDKGASDNGYITAQLATTRGDLPPNLKILVLIGQVINGSSSFTDTTPIFNSDDGLISYYGQRFIPQAGRLPLLQDSTFILSGSTGITVTERILGLEPGVNAFPGDPAGKEIKTSSYATIAGLDQNNNPVLLPVGYKHFAFASLTGGVDTSQAKPEVAVPAACGTAITCMHDTWLNLHAFLQANSFSCTPPLVLQNGFCVTAPVAVASVTNITPITATVSTATSFTVTGQNLPLTAVMALAEGTCQTPTSRTATGFTAVCTPGSAVGSKVVTISAASGGTVIDESKAIVVSAASSATSTFFDDFLGTSLDSSIWTAQGTGATTVSGGWAAFACYANAITKDKVTFSGSQIVIEAGLIGTGHAPWGRDTAIALTDTTTSGNRIQIGDTSYRGNGLYAYGSGAFNLAQTGNGISTSVYKEFRLTLSGTSLILERGDTLANLTETVTRTLPTSIVGKTFYLTIGTGGPDYCPATFDWVSVKTF